MVALVASRDNKRCTFPIRIAINTIAFLERGFFLSVFIDMYFTFSIDEIRSTFHEEMGSIDRYHTEIVCLSTMEKGEGGITEL